MFERQSALTGVLAPGGRNGANGQQLRIGEVRGWDLMQIAAFSTTSAAFKTAVRLVLHGDLPKRVGEAVNVDERRVLKTGLEQYWILMPNGDDAAPRLQDAVTSHIGSVHLLTHSRTCIAVEGAAARELLATGIAVDIHPDAFDVGEFVLTGLHHTPVLIHRIGANRYELFVMRTFALSVWEWLTDASFSFGYGVFVEEWIGHRAVR